MFVGFFEDIVLRPSELLDGVCDFIGLSRLPSRGDEVGKAANKGRTEAIPARHARRSPSSTSRSPRAWPAASAGTPTGGCARRSS